MESKAIAENVGDLSNAGAEGTARRNKACIWVKAKRYEIPD
jgi:hypothetical protein